MITAPRLDSLRPNIIVDTGFSQGIEPFINESNKNYYIKKHKVIWINT